MQRVWSADELGERWSLLPEDLVLLAGRIDAGKLGFAVQLAFWRQHGRFPDDEADVAPAVIAHLAAQIGIGVDALDGYAWAGRNGRRHRVAIIDHLAVVAFDEVAEARFRRWLADDVLPREFGPSVLEEELSGWFARSRVTRPGAYRLNRIMRSAQAAYDDAALQCVAERLDAGNRSATQSMCPARTPGHVGTRHGAQPSEVRYRCTVSRLHATSAAIRRVPQPSACNRCIVATSSGVLITCLCPSMPCGKTLNRSVIMPLSAMQSGWVPNVAFGRVYPVA